MTNTSTAAGRKEWVGLAVLALPALLASMDLSVLFMAAPWLSADLEPSGTQLLWIMDIYGFLMAGLLITMGTLGDRIGRRRLLLTGSVAFGAASVLAAYATSPEMLIAARALLGIGGATLAPSTLSLIRNMFHDPDQRRAAIGVWTMAFTGGVAVGPIIGGLLLENFWWGSVFLINLPVMALLLIVGPLLLPESKDAQAGRLDPVSVALSLAAVLPVIYGIKQIAEHVGVTTPAVGTIVAGVAMGALFIRRQRTLPTPLIDVQLFRRAAFSVATGSNAVLIFASAGMGVIAVQYIQIVLGMSPFTAAVAMLPTVAGTVVGIATANIVVRWIRPGFVVAAGVLTASIGFAMVALMVEADSAVAVVISCYTVMVLGIGMTVSLVVDLIMGSAPPERSGSAAAISETGAEFGGALGIAVLGSVATAVYRDDLGGVVADGLSGAAADAAGGSLGGAVAVAESLPEQAAGPLLQAAFHAYVNGFNVSAAVGAGLLAGMAVVAAILLRGVRTAGSGEASAAVPEPANDGISRP